MVPRLGIRDPNSFQKADLLAFISHIRARQEAHGIDDAFRWKNIADATGELEPARYGFNAKAAKTKQASARQKARRQARKRPKSIPARADQLAQLDGLIPMPDDGVETAAADSTIRESNATASSSRAMDPNIDPRLQSSPDGEQENASPEPEVFPLKRITDLEYQRLRKTIPQLILPPVNGPNDGPPEYEILPTLWDEYQQNLAKGLYDEAPVPVRQKRRTEDLMMEEASRVMGRNPSKRSRAAEALARQEADNQLGPTKRKSIRRKK